MRTQDGHAQQHEQHEKHRKHEIKMYLRFAAMILTAMVVMYWTMFAGTYEWGHVKPSESRLFMTFTMGGTMGLIMLGWMLNMYKNTGLNLLIVGLSLALLGGASSWTEARRPSRTGPSWTA